MGYNMRRAEEENRPGASERGAGKDNKRGASGGFTEEHMQKKQVFFPKEPALDENIRTELTQILAQDPRPGFHHDSERIYGFAYGSYEVRFKADDTAITVISITSRSENHTPDTAHPDH